VSSQQQQAATTHQITTTIGQFFLATTPTILLPLPLSSPAVEPQTMQNSKHQHSDSLHRLRGGSGPHSSTTEPSASLHSSSSSGTSSTRRHFSSIDRQSPRDNNDGQTTLNVVSTASSYLTDVEAMATIWTASSTIQDPDLSANVATEYYYYYYCYYYLLLAPISEPDDIYFSVPLLPGLSNC
jgi:hypothetical protein